jgi:hypothetical protein
MALGKEESKEVEYGKGGDGMADIWKEDTSFEIYPEKELPTFKAEQELMGNSAEGHVLEEAMKGFGRYAAVNRGHEVYNTGGSPLGSNVGPMHPTQTLTNPKEEETEKAELPEEREEED